MLAMVAPGYYKTCVAKLRLAFMWAYYNFYFFLSRKQCRDLFNCQHHFGGFCLFICFVILIFCVLRDDNYPSKFSSLFLSNKGTLK